MAGAATVAVAAQLSPFGASAGAPNNAPTGASTGDGLAHPVPLDTQPGRGKMRGLVLGGGGIYLLSWMVGYFSVLKRHGIDVGAADIAVGTSAGSLAGAILFSGGLEQTEKEFDEFAASPELFANLLNMAPPASSQLRALDVAAQAKNGDAQTIQSIGRAAMASHNPLGPDSYPEAVAKMIGVRDWPSPKLYITAVDCYTGERLVVSHADGIPANVACAASSSAPGLQGPVWLHDRLAMDGGIQDSSTHADVVGGVRKALVISLTDGGQDAVRLGLRVSGLPNTLQQEVQTLEKQGARVALKVVGLVPGADRVDSIMNPKWIKPCLENGRQRGEADIAEMRTFWNG